MNFFCKHGNQTRINKNELILSQFEHSKTEKGQRDNAQLKQATPIAVFVVRTIKNKTTMALNTTTANCLR